MKTILLVTLSTLLFALVGCGGSSDSSYTGTTTHKTMTFSCSSESAYDQCNNGQCDNCTCTDNCEVANYGECKNTETTIEVPNNSGCWMNVKGFNTDTPATCANGVLTSSLGGANGFSINGLTTVCVD